MKRNPAVTIVGVLIGLWVFVLSPLYQFSETVLGGQTRHLWAVVIFLGAGSIIIGFIAAKALGKEVISHFAILIFAITAFSYLAFEHEAKQWMAIRSGHFPKFIQ